MTAAKPHHLTARKLLLQHLDLNPGRVVATDLDPAEVGVVGDTIHAAGGDSYHLGKDQIRARGDRARYSVDESARDQNGLDNYASAMDIGYFKVTTARGTYSLFDFNAWLVALCKTSDPDTADLREVIYSLDGKTVRRWDRLGRRNSGDNSHTWHTHLSEHRDATGQRMIRLATRWLQHIGLIPEENDVTEAQLIAAVTKALASTAGQQAIGTGTWNHAEPDPATKGKTTRRTGGDMRNMESRAATRHAQLLAAVRGADLDEQAVAVAVLAGLTPERIAAAIPAGIAEQVVQELANRLAA